MFVFHVKVCKRSKIVLLFFYIKYAFKPGLEWLKYEDVRLQQKVCIVKVYVVLVFAHHVH